MKITEYSREKAEETAEQAKQQGKQLIPWLPDPHECPHCNVYCDATHGYVEEQAAYMDTWTCPNCETRFYRDEEPIL